MVDTKKPESVAKIAKEQETIINRFKDKAIKKGIIQKSPKIKIVSKDFAGKTLRIGKSFYQNGKQGTLKAGTKWEEIDAFFRKRISFTTKDFN